MSVVYRRNLGPVEHLEPGEWTDRTVSGRAVLCCAECGGYQEVPDTHRVEDGGLIVPALRCETVSCSRYLYIRLEAWGEAWV